MLLINGNIVKIQIYRKKNITHGQVIKNVKIQLRNVIFLNLKNVIVQKKFLKIDQMILEIYCYIIIIIQRFF